MLSDRIFFACVFAIAVGLIALAVVWPQGFGRPAPAPFGKPQVMSAAAQADLAGTTKAAKKAGATSQAKPAVATHK